MEEQNDTTPQADRLRAAARDSLTAFAALMHHKFEPVWHHRLIARAMERVASGDPEWSRLLISLPPRHGKTLLVSAMFPPWYMSTRPNHNVIVATYGGEYADDLGRAARAVASDPIFESLTGCGPDTDTQAIAKWKLTNASQYYAVSVGSSLTGRGANCLTAKTIIETDTGPRTIKAIFASFDGGTPIDVLSHGPNGPEFKRVTAVKRSWSRTLHRVTSTMGTTVDATAEHRFFVAGRGWIETTDLNPGDTLVAVLQSRSEDCYREYTDSVRSVDPLPDEVLVYDIQVEDNHCFFANGVLVHNCLILDDPIKNMEDAESAGARQRVWDWFVSTAYTRLEKDAKVIIIMTRWHEDDVIGRLMRGETASTWKTLFFPAVADADEYDTYGLLGDPSVKLRSAGEPLWPQKYDLPELAALRSQVGSRVWSSLYQGRPTPPEGAIFQRSYWRAYDLDAILDGERNPPWIAVFQSWDTAVSKKRGAAWSCCTTWGLGASRQFYLINVWRGRVEFPELRAKAKELAREWSPQRIWVEEQQTGGPLIAEFRRDMSIPIQGVRLRGDKEVRARLVSGIVEAGRVYLPKAAPWRECYIDELASFPVGMYADQVDSTTMALQLLTREEKAQYEQYTRHQAGGRVPASIFGR